MEDGKGMQTQEAQGRWCLHSWLYSQSIAVANWESAARSGPTLAGIGGWPAGRNSDLVVAVPLLGKDVRRRIEGDIGSRPLLTEVLFGHILRAVSLIAQTTRRTPTGERYRDWDSGADDWCMRRGRGMHRGI